MRRPPGPISIALSIYIYWEDEHGRRNYAKSKGAHTYLPDRIFGGNGRQVESFRCRFEAMIADAVEISTISGGHFRLMPSQYRVTPEKNGRALPVRIDISGTAPISLTPECNEGILDAARFIERR